MNPVIIREAAMSDCEAIYHLNCEEMGYDYELEKTKQRMEFLLNHTGNKLFVAEQNEIVVGYVHSNDYDLIYCSPLKNIMGIAVSKNVKRQGIGRRLLSAVEEWAKSTGATGIRLVSGSSRTDAHAFYAACGYQTKKEQKNFMKIF